MKYKVIDWEELNIETLQKLLDEVYMEGFQDGYQRGVRESTTISTPNHYKTYDATCSSGDCCCKH